MDPELVEGGGGTEVQRLLKVIGWTIACAPICDAIWIEAYDPCEQYYQHRSGPTDGLIPMTIPDA